MVDSFLEKPALRIEQGAFSPVYLFSLTTRELLTIATIRRISRNADANLTGFQRDEVKTHVENIAEYLESEGALLPNSIILSLNSETRFRANTEDHDESKVSETGTILIPLPSEDEAPAPGLIVDGQQRFLALRKANRLDFPVAVSAFITNDHEVLAEQFVRINSARPLKRALLSELLTGLPQSVVPHLSHRQVASQICDELNKRCDSPFHGLIRRPSSGASVNGSAPITDTSVVNMLEESLSKPSGCLFKHYNIATHEADKDAILAILLHYWREVKVAFPSAWGLPPRKSRLSHGVGIRAMGRLMDRVMGTPPQHRSQWSKYVRTELAHVVRHCRWTEGRWANINLQWNELQNTPRHIDQLSNFLIRTYSRQKERIP